MLRWWLAHQMPWSQRLVLSEHIYWKCLRLSQIVRKGFHILQTWSPWVNTCLKFHLNVIFDCRDAAGVVAARGGSPDRAHRYLWVSSIQDSSPSRYTVHHRSFHQLCVSSRSAFRHASESLDQKRSCPLLRIGLLIFSFYIVTQWLCFKKSNTKS